LLNATCWQQGSEALRFFSTRQHTMPASRTGKCASWIATRRLPINETGSHLIITPFSFDTRNSALSNQITLAKKTFELPWRKIWYDGKHQEPVIDGRIHDARQFEVERLRI